MKYSSFKYLFKQGFHNFKDNRLMSVASVGVVCSCLIIVGICGMLALNVNSFVKYLGDQNEVIIYVAEDAVSEDITAMDNLLNQDKDIAQYTFISKADALAEQVGYLGEYGTLLNGYQGDNNPLPASFRCRLKNLEAMQEASVRFSAMKGVDYVSTPTEIAGVLITLKNVTYYSGLIVLGILVMVSLVVISNTIRLTVFARRKEINIMKYVGATNGFIRMPFVVEGLLIGSISALITFGVVSGGYIYVYNYIHTQTNTFIATLSLSMISYKAVWAYLLGGFLCFGWFIGGVGSALSMKRYLEV
ncbi:MAG: permease-like cell division protein FtsX [Oscillospiraceae bacterium]